MGFFDKKQVAEIRSDFSSRADAFAYMLNYMITEKKSDPMTAAEKANDFAEIFAKNLGLPEKIEPPKTGIKKYLSMADDISKWVAENPKIVEYGIPVLTGLFGLFVGKKVEQAEEKHQAPQEPIDFDKL